MATRRGFKGSRRQRIAASRHDPCQIRDKRYLAVMTSFEPSRATALDRLNEFLPHAGRDYARLRNFDIAGHPHVSRLSPYISHRVLTEEETLTKTLEHHSPSAAEKFIQEVCWRTYWKGVLERRPALWVSYKADLNAALNRVQTEAGLRGDWEAACKGETGIDAFDHWAKELASTGYLHNHARMWFASIWVFTLRLPWALGADFFLRHLLDGDAASNTLSWRWVAGLQTVGKTYLARPDNIAKYTEGRFRPTDLAPFAAPLDGPPLPELGPVPGGLSEASSDASAILLTEDDLSTDWIPDRAMPIGVFWVRSPDAPLAPSDIRQSFVEGLANDTAERLRARGHDVVVLDSIEGLNDWAASMGKGPISAPYQPVGRTKDALSGANFAMTEVLRPYDAKAWSAATGGFFKFKSVIPKLLQGLKQPQLI